MDKVQRKEFNTVELVPFYSTVVCMCNCSYSVSVLVHDGSTILW
jgi:hypothetical protein